MPLYISQIDIAAIFNISFIHRSYLFASLIFAIQLMSTLNQIRHNNNTLIISFQYVINNILTIVTFVYDQTLTDLYFKV